MRLRFLGTGTSFGVPQIGCSCAVCRSLDPRDKRTRCGAVIETEDGTRLLIDTPPELRLQLVAAGVTDVDAVLFTHEHADHIHGIDDLRAFTMRRQEPLMLYGEAPTLEILRQRFPYIVDDRLRPLPGTTKPEGRLVPVQAGVAFAVRGVSIMPIAIPHGRTPVLAYRVGDIGYVTDAKSIPAMAREALSGVRVLVINALLRGQHPTHLSIAEAVRVAQDIGAERTYLTHLTHENSHAELAAELPAGITPAYDGLVVTLDPDPSP
ncbi:MAG: MBL fold metallo-hydrolase [Gemmatimonadaceae bacterium]|nr:MBL fold metallo-hydrolase [Gemmatimonadaceae bacterium]